MSSLVERRESAIPRANPHDNIPPKTHGFVADSRKRDMNNEPSEKTPSSGTGLMVLLGLILLSLVAFLVYLLKDFQQSLHDIPN